MSSFAALRELRIGCVAYLNARPLIHAYPGQVTLDHPSRLALLLERGELDVALVPIFAAFASPTFPIADGISISARGPVFSVFMAYRGCLTDIRTIALDPASRTSCHLLRVLLAEFHGLRPEYLASGPADAQLLIGNQAIEFRQKHGSAFRYLDLGEEWTRCTALPFVFAVWLMRSGLPNPVAVADALRDLKTEGLEHLDDVIREQNDFAPDFSSCYLRRHIRFDLGEPEKAGMARFAELLAKHGFIAPAENKLHFV